MIKQAEQSRGHTPTPPPCPHLCRKQGSRLLHYLSSDSLTALTLTNQPWVGLLFIYFLSWGLSRGLVWFWIKFTFHIYSEVWKESRKYQKLKFHFLELFLKEGSPTLSQLLGEGRYVQCWGRRAHHRTKLSGRVGNPGEERGKPPGTQWWSGVPPKGRGQDEARVHQMTTHPGPGPGRLPSFPSIHVSWKRSHFLPHILLMPESRPIWATDPCWLLGYLTSWKPADASPSPPISSTPAPPLHRPNFSAQLWVAQASIWL